MCDILQYGDIKPSVGRSTNIWSIHQNFLWRLHNEILMVFFPGKDFAEGWKKDWKAYFIHTILELQNVVNLFRIFSANFQKILCTFFPQKEMKLILRFRERFLREEMHVTVGRFSYIWKLFERQKRECTLGHSFILSIQSWCRK